MSTVAEQIKLLHASCMRQSKDIDEKARASRLGVIRKFKSQLINVDDRNPDAWWHLAMSQSWLNDKDGALDSLKVLLKLSPKYPEGWVQYGLILEEKGQPEQALKALSQALQLDPANDCAREAARICEKQRDFAGQIHYLMLLEANGSATGYDLNNIGRAYWEKKHFANAIIFYRRAAFALQNSRSSPLAKAAPYFNLALVYSHNDVSQGVDAIDCLKRALKLHQYYTLAKDQLNTLQQSLEAFSSLVLSHGDSGLDCQDWYRCYINPFELLVGIDQSYQLESFDAKTIQRLKKKLLQEIDLEDGAIDYVANLKIDKSKAIEVCEDLNDESLKRYHWLVFKDSRLLSFLSRGNIRHFLYSQDYDLLNLLEELDNEGSGFKRWLSPIFAKQYELVLTKALKDSCVPLVQSLFAGRRWVLNEHNDICFEGAKRQVDLLLEPLRLAAEEAKHLTPAISRLEAILDGNKINLIFNLLPEPFREQQEEAVSLLRSVAIKAFNEHGDAILSHSILKLSRRFNFKSASLKQQLEEDFKQIEKNIAEERKHEARLTKGNDAWQITKEGVRKGTVFIPADKVIAIRWGILINGTQWIQNYNFLMVCHDGNGSFVNFSWESSTNSVPLGGLQLPVRDSSLSDHEKQKKFFDDLVNAALNYIVPSICEKHEKNLNKGKVVKVGPCSIQKEHIQFEMPGWFKSKQIIIPWARVEMKVQNGSLMVYDKTNPKLQTEMDMRSTENAVVLRFFAHLFGKK